MTKLVLIFQNHEIYNRIYSVNSLNAGKNTYFWYSAVMECHKSAKYF